MSISYPIDMPTDVIGISNITLSARNAVGKNESPFTYQQQIFRHPGQSWAASIQIAPVNREFGEPWVAFLLALEGPTGSFLLGDPLGNCPRGSIAEGFSIVVNGATAAQARFFSVRGLPVSTAGLFLPGDYLQLGSGATATLHKILLSVDSDVSGEADVYVWPRPRRALVDGEAIVYTDTKGRFRLSNNQQAWEIANNLRYGVSFEAMEAIG